MEGDLGGTFGGACVLSGLRIRLKVGRGFGGDVGGRGVLPTYIYRLKPFYSRVGVGAVGEGASNISSGAEGVVVVAYFPFPPPPHTRTRISWCTNLAPKSS